VTGVYEGGKTEWGTIRENSLPYFVIDSMRDLIRHSHSHHELITTVVGILSDLDKQTDNLFCSVRHNSMHCGVLSK
jgi:hypothetical protein